LAVVPLLLLAAPTSVSLSLHPPRMSLLDTTLITGASSGIGEASARALASAGCKSMVLAARRLDRLEALRDNLLADHEGLSIHAVQLDVTDLDAVLRLPEELPKDFSEVSVLLNNAGLAAGFGGVDAYSMKDMEVMMDTNVKGLAACCRAFVPGMKKRGRGHIINISSIAGKAAYPNGAFYCASKYAVEAITASLRAELVATPLRVTSVSPGWVNEGTEFSKVRFGGDGELAEQLYEGLEALSADDVADAIAFAATRKPHVQVADIYILPTTQAHPFEGGLHRSKL
jgi:3-hydroxy acid dehydrogenase/malonic semialdehyde reductase